MQENDQLLSLNLGAKRKTCKKQDKIKQEKYAADFLFLKLNFTFKTKYFVDRNLMYRLSRRLNRIAVMAKERSLFRWCPYKEDTYFPLQLKYTQIHFVFIPHHIFFSIGKAPVFTKNAQFECIPFSLRKNELVISFFSTQIQWPQSKKVLLNFYVFSSNYLTMMSFNALFFLKQN